MRVIPIAASVIALGALLGGFTASADAPETVQQHIAASVSLADDNNGNG